MDRSYGSSDKQSQVEGAKKHLVIEFYEVNIIEEEQISVETFSINLI